MPLVETDFWERAAGFPLRLLWKNPPALLKPAGWRKSYVRDIFLPLYAPHLGLRRSTFQKAFEILDMKPEKNYRIVETGTSRRLLYNMPGDGSSTFLFDAFVRYYEGSRMTSIDLDETACRRVQASVSSRTRVLACDSLLGLKDVEGPLDLVYLDSLDLDFFDPDFSALHHLKEFRLVDEKIRPGGLLLIDDTPASSEFWPEWLFRRLKEKGMRPEDLPSPAGKGVEVQKQLAVLGTYTKVLHEYQCLYRKNA